MKNIAVIICSHSRQTELLRTLEHLNQHSSVNFRGVRCQVIIVFDGDHITAEYRVAAEAVNWGVAPLIVAATEHMGQNAGRNLGLRLAREAGYDYSLLLDDDAVLHPQTEIAHVLELFDRIPRAGAIGLTVIVESTGDDQYYAGYPDREIFPVPIPCLAATVLDLRTALHEDFFFPKNIKYGSDEWALSIRIRDAGKQVFATRHGHAIHRHVQSGRTADIRYRLQYAHGFVFGLLPAFTGLALTLARISSILRPPLLEPKHVVSRIRGVVRGWLDGLSQKAIVKHSYGLQILRKDMNPLLAEAYAIKHPFLGSILRWL